MDKEKVTYWKVAHTPDLTETGRFQRVTYVKAVWKGHPGQESTQAVLENMCAEMYGPPTAYVQGVAATANWRLRKVTEPEFEKAVGVSWGADINPARRVVVFCGRRSVRDPEYVVKDYVPEPEFCPHCGQEMP